MATPPTLQPKEEDSPQGSLLETTLELLNTTVSFDENDFDNVSQGSADWPGHNGTADPAKESAVVRHLFPVFQVLITVFYAFGIVGNISALYFIKKSETQRNRKQTLMLRCLALNDLVALLGSFVLMYMHLYLPVVNSRWFCMLRVILRAVGVGSGCVALVMAVERWLSLTHPFTYQRHVTHTVIRRSVVGLWALNLLLMSAPFFGFGLWYDEHAKGFTPCVRYRDATTAVDRAYAYLVFAYGMIMCCIIVCCNMAVIRVLCMMRERLMPRRHSRTSCRSTSSTSDSKMNHATVEELSFARLMAVLSIFIVICWVPQLLTIVVAQLHGPDPDFDRVYRIADIFISLNFTLDPYMYVLFRRHQRCGSRHLRKLKAYLCPQRRHESPTRALINGSVRSSSHNSNNSTGKEGNDSCGQATASSNVPSSEKEYVPLQLLLSPSASSDVFSILKSSPSFKNFGRGDAVAVDRERGSSAIYQ
ncbi:prostaglandin D2 receptor-like [Penaeus vannamei]|uniref:prostaglandin D2 receptor-like n=1 Tax=Penaeus vannamei TaxID=6689 RepID=UPI00387F9980